MKAFFVQKLCNYLRQNESPFCTEIARLLTWKWMAFLYRNCAITHVKTKAYFVQKLRDYSRQNECLFCTEIARLLTSKWKPFLYTNCVITDLKMNGFFSTKNYAITYVKVKSVSKSQKSKMARLFKWKSKAFSHKNGTII